MEPTLSPDVWDEIHAHCKSMTMPQQQCVLDELDKAELKKQALGLLYFYGACRTAEARRLRRDHICNVRHFVALRSAKRRNAPVGRPKWRCVPLPCDVIDLLLSVPVGRDQRLFPIHRTTALRWMKPILERAGCVGAAATTRSFRHAFKDRSERFEVPTSVTANFMGHSVRTDVMHYGDPLGYELAAFAKATWDVQCYDD